MLKIVKHWILKKIDYLNKSAYRNSLDHILKNKNIVHKHVFIDDFFSIDLPEQHFKITIGDCVHLKKYCHILMGPNSELTIGTNVFFNNYCSLNCMQEISIGENTMFGEGVKIYDHDHLYKKNETKLLISKDQFTTEPVKIGKNCWIGSNVTILKGVVIGDNTIIGANNLIYKSIKENSIIKGDFRKANEGI